MTITHNQIVKLLSDIATNHQMINGFGFGDIWEEGATETLDPVVLWGIDLEHQIANSVENQTSVISLNYKLLVMDLVDKGEGNENDVLSDTLQIVLDVLAILGYKGYQDLYTLSYSNIKPFTERLDHEYSGHEVDITFRIPFDNSICQVPLSSISSVGSSSTSEATGSLFFTDTTNTQTITGTSMTLPNTPSFIYGVFRNGVRLAIGTDYTISLNVITFVDTMAAESITVVYKY